MSEKTLEELAEILAKEIIKRIGLVSLTEKDWIEIADKISSHARATDPISEMLADALTRQVPASNEHLILKDTALITYEASKKGLKNE